MNLDNKLQTNVGEGGSLLSGGQKQRLALARMILTNPEVYIFDEATSNIDVESEDSILKTIYDLSKEKTVVVISHRLANIENADVIYVLDKGQIAEFGKHNELMNNKSTYYNLYTKQSSLEDVYEEDINDVDLEVAISE